MQDKLQLLRGDRDEKDKQLKKQKAQNDELRKKLKEMESQQSQLNLKIEQGFNTAASLVHHGSQSIANKPKYNSIDVGYDEENFAGMNQKNSKTNTNGGSQKRMLQQPLTQSNQNVYQQHVNCQSVNLKSQGQPLHPQFQNVAQNNNFMFVSTKSGISNSSTSQHSHHKQASIQSLQKQAHSQSQMNNANLAGMNFAHGQMAGDPAGQKMSGMHKQVGLTKSGSKQSKKNLLNQNSNDSVGMNPYLLEINKQIGGQPQNQLIPQMYNNFQGAQPGFQHVQSQKQLMKGQHKKSESIDFVNGNGYQKIGQYQAKHIGAQQVQNNQKQFRKNMREHNKSIGAIPDSNTVLGLGSSDSLGLVAGGLEARNKHSVDSADLLQRNMQRNQINTIDQNNLQNLSNSSIQMGSLAISNSVNPRDSFPKNGLASSI